LGYAVALVPRSPISTPKMEMQLMWTVRVGLIALVALSAGCSAGRSSPGSPTPKPGTAPAEAAESGPSKTRVEIDNQNFSDMDVYLIDRGTHLFLGSAAGLSKTTLLIPSLRSTWEVRLLAEPIGGSAPIRTPALMVAPNQNVYWTIGANAASSFASAG
jgi:hypothetical protein